MTDQADKAVRFRALHERAGAFIIPNPWDVGTARILAGSGFEALATTSAGMAFALGLPDGGATRDQMLAHCRAIVAATPLPVSADLEKGFGDSPESAAETVQAAAACGLAGCSIEDYSGGRDEPIYDFNLALDRIAAAVEAARGLPHDFVFTARCENYIRGNPDLDDTLKRLQAYESAGADVLYAPGLSDLETIEIVCDSLTKPVNVVMGLMGGNMTLDELAAAGVKRVSVGAALARVAFGAFVKATREMAERGTFTFAEDCIGFPELQAYFTPPES